MRTATSRLNTHHHRLLRYRWPVVVLLLLAFGSPAADEPVTEETLKVALTYKLTKFVDWPDHVMPESLPFTICTRDAGAMGRTLRSLNGRTTHGLEVEVRLLDGAESEEYAGCQIIYVAAEGLDQMTRESARKHASLLIGDQTGFAAAGGDIEIGKKGKRFGFVINLSEAKKKGLRIAAPLLQLSEVIEEPSR